MKLLGLDKELLPPTAVTNSSAAACVVGYTGCNRMGNKIKHIPVVDIS